MCPPHPLAGGAGTISPTMAYEPWSLADLADRIAAEDGVDRRYKLVLEFVRGYLDEPASTRGALLSRRPSLIGDPGWDAVVAGLADHYAFHDEQPPPTWTSEPERFCFPPFLPVDNLGVRVMARVHSPAGFLRHGILLMPEDLQPV